MKTSSTTYKKLFISQTEELVGAFENHTGATRSWIFLGAMGQSNYPKLMARHSMGVERHDKFLRNLSALWPPDLSWPDHIPRPSPENATYEDLPKERRQALWAKIEERKARKKEELENG